MRCFILINIISCSSLQDQFDTIDFSDNDIRKFDGFPLLKRLKTLFFNNNRICRIAEGLEHCIPNLDTLMLTGNMIQELSDLEPLVPLKNLRTLCLLQNPVSAKPQYRQFVVYKFPSLRLLDFRKIKKQEREAAVAFFRSKKGKDIAREVAKKAKAQAQNMNGLDKPAMTPDDQKKIKDAIAKASSLEEIQRLSKLLHAGQIPGERQRNGIYCFSYMIYGVSNFL